jgi:ppGpp synthetase/RelA/SpoT-type nucleotidyltranferase
MHGEQAQTSPQEPRGTTRFYWLSMVRRLHPMKIIKQLRDLYQASSIKYERLAVEVRETLKPRVEVAGWFFLSRLKDLESFALKVETGRVPDPNQMEDFYACTIVVPTILQIDDAEQLVRSLYDFHERRPAADTTTSKASSSFAFDDLRLYVNRRSLGSGKDPELDGLIFEVQVKTILQHAWSTATHDLIYKTDTVSWPRERIAYQVKAMLEHAEVAIAEANRISEHERSQRKTTEPTVWARLVGPFPALRKVPPKPII